MAASFDKSIDEIQSSQIAKFKFEYSFKQSVARGVTGVEVDQVAIVDIVAGSVRVTFYFKEPVKPPPLPPPLSSSTSSGSGEVFDSQFEASNDDVDNDTGGGAGIVDVDSSVDSSSDSCTVSGIIDNR